ncbi:uncharacterized protein LOC143291848 [Babylonia areolata]|uniref:uncharacterized protein LOC143291848 n=1 Tax=Babylonia areolata TaxID=304850 RepID=UPI003FD0D7E8
MPDGVTLIPPDALTSPQGTQLSPAQGNASNSSMARLTEDAGGTGALSAGYPWIPALLVGCGMVAFLSLSFYSHHKRVRRKREVLMDYLSVLIQSGALARGRSVSILCNTNSLALSQLGKSFRISRDRNGSVEASDILRDRYFKDLSELSNSHKKTRNILRRFISAPPERKFRQVTSRLLTLNKAPWLSRGGLSTLARNLSLPEDFDFGEDDFPSSLSEARTSIAQGVLLNPSTMQTEDADGSKPMNRPDISPDSLSQ